MEVFGPYPLEPHQSCEDARTYCGTFGLRLVGCDGHYFECSTDEIGPGAAGEPVRDEGFPWGLVAIAGVGVALGAVAVRAYRRR
jgi:hypothetical protein